MIAAVFCDGILTKSDHKDKMMMGKIKNCIILF